MSIPDVEPASAVVLAGGLSRRMGHDKRRLRLWGAGGPMLLEQTVATVRPLCAEVVAVLNDPEEWPALGARLVPDLYPAGGALGGIYSGLAACAHPHALVVACDMPLLSPALLGAMLARPRNYDVLAPRSPRPGSARNSLDVEPLHAIYSKACLGPMREALEARQLGVAAFFSAVRAAYLEPDEIATHDPHGRSFLNLNSPQQLAEVERLIGRGTSK